MNMSLTMSLHAFASLRKKKSVVFSHLKTKTKQNKSHIINILYYNTTFSKMSLNPSDAAAVVNVDTTRSVFVSRLAFLNFFVSQFYQDFDMSKQEMGAVENDKLASAFDKCEFPMSISQFIKLVSELQGKPPESHLRRLSELFGTLLLPTPLSSTQPTSHSSSSSSSQISLLASAVFHCIITALQQSSIKSLAGALACLLNLFETDRSTPDDHLFLASLVVVRRKMAGGYICHPLNNTIESCRIRSREDGGITSEFITQALLVYLKATFLNVGFAEKYFQWCSSFQTIPLLSLSHRFFVFQFYKRRDGQYESRRTLQKLPKVVNSDHDGLMDESRDDNNNNMLVTSFESAHEFVSRIETDFASDSRCLHSVHLLPSLAGTRYFPLTIDIDANDYDGSPTSKSRLPSRFCCSGSSSFCRECWKIVVCGCRLIEVLILHYDQFNPRDLFLPDAPENKIRFFYTFSGRRGVHIFIRDRWFVFVLQNHEKLDEILNYLQCLSFLETQYLLGIDGVYRDYHIILQGITFRGMDQFYAILQSSFESIYCCSSSTSSNSIFKQSIAAETVKRHLDDGIRKLSSLGSLSDSTQRALEDANPKKDTFCLDSWWRQTGGVQDRLRRYVMLAMLAPRIDRQATGKSHSMRAPFSVHEGTLNINMPIKSDEMDSFDPVNPVVKFRGQNIPLHIEHFMSTFEGKPDDLQQFITDRLDELSPDSSNDVTGLVQFAPPPDVAGGNEDCEERNDDSAQAVDDTSKKVGKGKSKKSKS